MTDEQAQVIEVRDLVFEYPSARALHGISLRIAPRTITALVGPNGAGKTTLLRCIAALEPPYSGQVKVAGLDVQADPRRIHGMIGYLPDFFGLYDDLSVERALLYAALAHGLGSADAHGAVRKTAQRVGLLDRLGTPAGELSRGLRQRLAIGQAIVHEPRVLLLDEPASGLDPQARRDLSRLFLDLKALGITLIVSSHILVELEDYSDEMIIIDKGRIRGEGAIAIRSAQTVRVRIELARPERALAEILSKRMGLTASDVSDMGAIIETPSGAEDRARILKNLIDLGLAVAAFVPSERRLEDAYFEEVEAG